MTCPHCGNQLEGLGTYCHACGSYTDGERAGPPDTDTGGPSEPKGPRGDPRASRQVVVLPLPPSVNAMYRSAAGARKGMTDAVLAYVNGNGTWKEVLSKLYVNVLVSREGRTFKKDAESWLAAQPTQVLQGDVRMTVTFYLRRRGSDVANYTKALADVLEGVLYENDKQIAEWHYVRRLDRANPRVVVICEPDDGSTVLDPGAEFNYDLGF